jgi:hypothetical protein
MSRAGSAALKAWIGSMLGGLLGAVAGGATGALIGGLATAAQGGVGAFPGAVLGAAMGTWVGYPSGAWHGVKEWSDAPEARGGALAGAIIGPMAAGLVGIPAFWGVGSAVGAYLATNERRSNPTSDISLLIADDTEVIRVPVLFPGPDLMVHPSVRTNKESSRVRRGLQPKSWSVTHIPSGQLVAVVGDRDFAMQLGREIQQLAGPALGSSDPEIAARAIAGPGMYRAGYVVDMMERSFKRSPQFETYIDWQTDRRMMNPSDTRKKAAVAAATGGMIGGLAGAGVGLVSGGALGAAIGAAWGATGAGTGVAVGGVYGTALGYSIGTIWGAVRKLGRDKDSKVARTRVKLAAGGGAALGLAAGMAITYGTWLILPPIGAAVGAYLAA